jgi:endoglucanase
MFLISTWTFSSAQTAGEHKLRDIEVFTTEQYAGWAGSGQGLEIEASGGGLPIDDTVTTNGLSSLRVIVTGDPDSGGWWQAIIAGPGWESYSIAPYIENGSLEFSVKGLVGGEQFAVNINDIQPGREPLNVASVQVPITEFITMSEDWQRVSIPLTKFTAENGTFNSDQMFTVGLSGVNSSPLAFWIADVRFTSPDSEPSYPAIKVNQNCYRPDGYKQVIVSGFTDELSAEAGTPFKVRSVSTNEVAFEGTLELIADLDSTVSGERVLQADFTPLDQPGHYYLSVEAFQVADSTPFYIDSNVYGPLVTDSMRYFFLQRAGIPLDVAQAGPFARGAGHPQDAQAEFRSGTLPTTDVSGGWYDAGDYGKYTNAGATAVSDLLWAYEFFPDQFPDNHLNIPESGNGVSDLLDEIRWELDWMMRMQDPDSGGFYHMVQATEDLMPDQAAEPRFVEDTQGGEVNIRPTATTGSAVAALAHASIVFESVDSDYAQKLLAAAELGYTYLEDNLDQVNPISGPYADSDDLDNRFWAATTLYRATDTEKYHTTVKALYPHVQTQFESQFDNAYGVEQMGMIAWLSYAFSENQDPEVADFFETQFNGWSDHMTDRWEASTWNQTLLDEDYYWGSNYVALTTPLVMYAGNLALGQDTQATAAISQQSLDYLLGGNPLAISYVSGYGPNSIKNLYSVMWSYDGIDEVPAGVLVGGPNEYSNPLFFSNFAGKRYVDGNGFWTLNEHTIYWNSALVFHAAMQSDSASLIATEKPAPIPEPAVAEPTATIAPTEAPVETETPATEVSAVELEPAEPAQDEVPAAIVPLPPNNQTIILAAIIGAMSTLVVLGVGFFIWRMFGKAR